ncbi:hypothetical protein [Spongiibacter tropicus]|uniref:hypothetical protein n=1 Tax=Spongiibacter tropicus TaxID=454602 RepID=UPI0003B65DAD|nr:hypothetical protein [Spongiibacter tropicus]
MSIYDSRVLTLGVNSNDDDLPHISEFLRYVPEEDLVEFWTALSGLGLDDEAAVESWVGVNGSTATQVDASKKPLFLVDEIAPGIPGIKGDGTNDILQTSVTPPSQGVLLAGFKTPPSLSGVKVLMGSYSGSASSAISIGFNGTEIAAQVGDQNFTTLKGGLLTPSTLYIATLSWNATDCFLRLNGEQVASASWDGSVGTAVLGLLGRNAGSPNYNTLASLGAAGIYGAFKSGADMELIEERLANSIGLSI